MRDLANGLSRKRCDHYTPDVNYGCVQPLDREGDYGSNPEVAPYPVAEDPQSTDSEVRHSHFALEGIACWPTDGRRGGIGENRMRNEKDGTYESNAYHEEPLQEDLCYSSFCSGLLIQIDVYSANHQA
jgi:hypothetical protein